MFDDEHEPRARSTRHRRPPLLKLAPTFLLPQLFRPSRRCAQSLRTHYRDDRALVSIMLAMSNMGSFSHDRWQCATVAFSTLALDFSAALDHFPRMVDVQRYGLRAFGKFAQCPSNKGLFLQDPEEQLSSLRVIATIAKLHENDATVQRYGLVLARGLGFESVQAVRKHVLNQDKVKRKNMEKRAEEEEERREKAKKRAKLKQMSSKLASKTSWLAKANAGE